MPNPWTIIGWLLLIVFIVFPLVIFIIRKILFYLIWNEQSEFRKLPPRRYQIWRSLNSKDTYYINSEVSETSGSVLVSSDANNRGGTYYTLKEWATLVNRKRLIRK